MAGECIHQTWRKKRYFKILHNLRSSFSTDLSEPFTKAGTASLQVWLPHSTPKRPDGVGYVSYGVFFLAWEGSTRMFDNSFTACAFFLLFFSSSLFKSRLGSAHYLHSIGQDQSTVAQRAETTVADCSLTRCVWGLFLTGSHTTPAQRHKSVYSDIVGSRMYACF